MVVAAVPSKVPSAPSMLAQSPASPVSIAVTGNTVDVGLTTFPTIQRRGTGIRDTGALPKKT